MKGVINFIVFLILTNYGLAQTPTVKTFIDKDNILLGEQFTYKVVASFGANEYNVNWLTIPDSLAHFELIKKSKIDSSFLNNTTTLSQILTLTSFDSGKWKSPAFAISFLSKNVKPLQIFTDSININVGYALSDSTNQLRDIKPIIEDEVNVDYQKIILLSLLGLVMLLLLIYLFKKFRKKKVVINQQSNVSAYEQAMQELEKLRQYNLKDAVQVKQYHSSLSKLFKRYFSLRTKVNMQNKTTGDVLIYLNQHNQTKALASLVSAALRCGDAVKFAKYLPPINESENCLQHIENAIKSIHKNNVT